jgi:putative transposase
MREKPYPTDLKDAEWALLEPLLPAKRRGRPLKHSQREMINAILYVLRTGGSWAMLPRDFPPSTTVYTYFRRLQRERRWEQLNVVLRQRVRQQAGRESDPATVIVDSQSVPTVERGANAASMEANG